VFLYILVFRECCIVAVIKHTVAYITRCTVHFAASARPHAVRPPRGLLLQILVYRNTCAETDDGAQTENDRRHQRDLADGDGVNGIMLLSVDGCNQSLTATADMGADKTLRGVDGNDSQAIWLD